MAEAVTRRSGVVGEKMELDGYNVLEGDNISVYDHMRRHTLATMVKALRSQRGGWLQSSYAGGCHEARGSR